MQRKSNAISGCVNFPINDPSWVSSGEGGMVVKLVVCDNQDWDEQFAKCCGATVFDILSEELVGDDRVPSPSVITNYDSVELVQAEQKAWQAWEQRHYPHFGDTASEGIEQYLSRDYLATLVLGTTGWSGYCEKDQKYWTCAHADLSEDGKQLYTQVQKLYPDCDLHILTFLDT